MTVRDVVVVSIPVSDPQRALLFYTDTLGFELLRDDSSVPGMRWLQVAPAGGTTALTLVTWFDSMPAGSLQGLVFASDDVHGDHAKLAARGARFDGPPERRPYGVEAVLRDPDGNALVLLEGN
jgi:catechol 2,3-dioxygenase-like lactoylglutathione lyase family enzyme